MRIIFKKWFHKKVGFFRQNVWWNRTINYTKVFLQWFFCLQNLWFDILKINFFGSVHKIMYEYFRLRSVCLHRSMKKIESFGVVENRCKALQVVIIFARRLGSDAGSLDRRFCMKNVRNRSYLWEDGGKSRNREWSQSAIFVWQQRLPQTEHCAEYVLHVYQINK